MARSRQVEKAVDPYTDGSGWGAPEMNSGMLYRDVGSYGLRQYGGWVREQYLRALQGREAQRVFREMGDGSAVVGSVLFAITAAMRKVAWQDEAANDTPQAREAADFAHSLRVDMSHPWEDHITEALSMLQFGFCPTEIVYKRRLGRKGTAYHQDDASSAYNDGKIGIRRLPIRGQETILRWAFDQNGQILGLTQQPWIGPLIDIPIEKLLLFRPSQHKNNPEGRSILLSSYRPWYFQKRMEELEAVLFERLGGLPIVRVPSALLEAAKSQDTDAVAALDMYKRLARDVRLDDQMGLVIPSDCYKDANGAPTAQKMYDFELKTPDRGGTRVDSDKIIHRYNVDILKSVLADFIDLGHQARGTQNLAVSKIDMFYSAIEGWLKSLSSVHNRYLLPRVWALNGMNMDIMPQYSPDLAMRVDLDVLGKFILSMSQSGMALFPDRDLENYIRGAAGMPDVLDELGDYERTAPTEDIANRIGATGEIPGGAPDVAKHLLGLAALTRRRQLHDTAQSPAITTKLTAREIDAAALVARPPTPGQRHVGNHRKGHVNLHGLSITIENPRGSIRNGAPSPAHYGYLRRAGPAADGAALDVYLGPDPESTTAFVVDQLHSDTGAYDEAKVLIGWANMHDALSAYRQAFADGRGDERIGAVHRVSIAGLKNWVRTGELAEPLGPVVGKSGLNGSAALANGLDH